MTASRGARLLALRCDALAGTTGDAVTDLLAHFDPDLVYVAREETDVRVVSRLRRECDRPVVHARGSAAVRTETVGGVTFAFAGSLDFVGGAATADGEAVPPDADYVVCDDLRTATDAVTMEATLDGLEHAARYQARTDGGTEGRTEATFLTGALEASYDYVWRAQVDGEAVRLPVRGLAPLRRSGAPELACLACDAEGRVATASVPADRFGLRALTDVGAATAGRLEENGYGTRADVAAATRADLRAIRGIGDATARTIRGSARALAEDRVVRRTDAPVPAADYDPLFVDIETDGLSPSIIWLIGVYDPGRGEYVDFVDADPSLDDPGRATREFVTWLAAEHDRPSLVAWNGHQFDYKHLTRFVGRHAPDYADYWAESVFDYDLYDWAVRKGNAVLPGRTNRLADVAAALDCERDAAAAALDGKSLARTIQRLLRSPERAGEVDWDAARAYCEADVRELAAVYDAIADATPGRERADAPTDETTTQTGLLDF